MCFETTKSARAKIAKEDIVCWKKLNKDNSNFFGGLLGIPSFVYKKKKIQPIVKIKKEGILIAKGYHSYKEQAYTGNPNVKICRFTIPKGTRYFENETEYVSETIMMV